MSTTQTPSPFETTAQPARRDPAPGLAERAGDQLLRGIVFLAGVGLLVGFFLPWLRLGEFAAMSGLSLMVTSGTAVSQIAGPARGLLILIPACGAALVGCSLLGHRASVLAGLIAGVAVLGFGLFTLARVFLETMGSGMWIVAASALIAIGAGIAGIARTRGGA